MAEPAAALVDAAGGDFFLTLLSFLIIFIVGVCGYMVYQMPKNWEKSTDRVVEKICEVIKIQTDMQRAQTELISCYQKHDIQAKEIKADVSEAKDTAKEIKTTLSNRPCINGRHE